MRRFMTVVSRLDLSFQVIAGLALAFMMIVTLADVIMRTLGKPIVGSMEIISFSGAVVAGFAIPYSSLKKTHIYVDFLKSKLSARSWILMQAITKAIGLLLFLFIGYNFILYGLTLMETGEVSPGFRIPYYPITFGLSVACFLESLTLLCDIFALRKEGAHE